MNLIRHCGIASLSLLSVAAYAQELLGDPSFALTPSIDNVHPWSPPPNGVWGDPNDIHFTGTLVTGECRVDPCARIRSRAVSIPDGLDCATAVGDDKPGCKEGIRQHFPAVDSRNLVRISFFARRAVDLPVGWNVSIAVVSRPADVNPCWSKIVAPDSTSYGEISLSAADLSELSSTCFNVHGTYEIVGVVLTKLGVRDRDVYVDDFSVAVEVTPPPPTIIQVGMR